MKKICISMAGYSLHGITSCRRACVPINLVFLNLSVLELRPMYATDIRQTLVCLIINMIIAVH